MEDLLNRIRQLEIGVHKLYQAPTVPNYTVVDTSLPWDAVNGQVVVGDDGTLNWFANNRWHKQQGVPSNISESIPQDAVDGQIAIGKDGSFHWYVNDQWWTAPFMQSTDINSPQDVLAGQIVIGDDETFHWSPEGIQSFE